MPKESQMIIVSACLAGFSCRYDGKDNLCETVANLVREGKAIPVCPEQLGGLPTPRKPAGIFNGLGDDVLIGKAEVKTVGNGENVTVSFTKGAEEVLKVAKLFGVKKAILKQRSPSCGCGKTWQLDEDLKNHVVEGNGVTAALLKQDGIEVLTEEDI
jgi:uncharacterized protein YbbK (DUF523 family)